MSEILNQIDKLELVILRNQDLTQDEKEILKKILQDMILDYTL